MYKPSAASSLKQRQSPADRTARSEKPNRFMKNRQMRVLVCPNAFKGSLSAVDAARAIAEGFERTNTLNQYAVRYELDETPLADGGDGTLDTLVAATGGCINYARVHGPLGDLVDAAWGRLGGDQSGTAIIEMAKASGLGL